jgi:DNA-binding NtrC family response regulator
MKSRILIVDDEPTVLSTMKVILHTKGYEVVTTASAAEARAVLEAHGFEVVLTDMRMETELAGYDVVVAAKERQPAPAVIIMTAVPLLPSEWKTRGVDAVFAKPPNIQELLQTIEELAGQKGMASEA